MFIERWECKPLCSSVGAEDKKEQRVSEINNEGMNLIRMMLLEVRVPKEIGVEGRRRKLRMG